MSTNKALPIGTNGNDMMISMTEGQKLRQALTRAGKHPIDLTRACGVSKGAATRWFNMAKIGEAMWLTIRPGLKKLEIEPTLIKEDDPQSVDDVDLVREFKRGGFSSAQASIMLRILDTGVTDQKPLVWYLRGLLDDLKK